MLEELTESVGRTGGLLVSLTTRFRYDETPLRTKSRSVEPVGQAIVPAGAVDQLLAQSCVAESSAAAKLVQVEGSGSALIMTETGYHLVCVDLPIGLSCVDRCTAVTTREVLQRCMSGSAHVVSQVHEGTSAQCD